jgi:hypothetical protein
MPMMTDTVRLEAELLCGTETFRNHLDVKFVGSGAPLFPGPAEAVCVAFKDWVIANYFPDVTLVNIFQREIWYKQGPPPHPEHPPIWVDAVSLPGTANTTYGGAHNSNYLPQEVCIYAKKTTSTGRSGKMFLRNVLSEPDVQSTVGGFWSFSSHAGGFDQATFNSTSNTLLGPFETATPASGSWAFCVTHLEHIKDTDTRTPYSTVMFSLAAIKPTWNRSTR